MSSDVSACESSAYKMWVRMDLPTGSVGELQFTQSAAAEKPLVSGCRGPSAEETGTF